MIVIPTYDEKENIKRLINDIKALYPSIHILVVDDNSPDGTGRIVEQLCKKFSTVELIIRKKKGGLGSALILGFKYAMEKNYKNLITMDADYSHEPKQIDSFLRYIAENDLVIGSRYIDGGQIINWSIYRRLLSKLGNIYTTLLTGIPVKDVTTGYNCYNIEKLRQIDIKNIKTQGYVFQIEMKYMFWKKGLRIKEIPITFVEREKGKSKISKRIIIEAFVWVIKHALLNKN